MTTILYLLILLLSLAPLAVEEAAGHRLVSLYEARSDSNIRRRLSYARPMEFL